MKNNRTDMTTPQTYPGLEQNSSPEGSFDSGVEDSRNPLFGEWWNHFRKRSLVYRTMAAVSWIIILYTLLILIVAGLYSNQPLPDASTGEAVPKDRSGPVWLVSRPMEWYLDTRDFVGDGLDGSIGFAYFFGIWVLCAPYVTAFRRRKRVPPIVIEPEIELGPSPFLFDEDFRDIREVEKEDEAGDPEIPEHIHQMITRFIDIRTLQPRGILRSVILLLLSDIESYRHLLRSKECLLSIEKLRQMPPDIFDSDECREMIEEEGHGESLRNLGLQFPELVPSLLQRIEGQLDDSAMRSLKKPSESTGSLSVSWYTKHPTTRLRDILTLQPVGVLRSVLILMNTDLEASARELRAADFRDSLKKLRTLPPDYFDGEDCQKLLRKRRYAKLMARLNYPLSALGPMLVSRIEGGND